MLLIQFPLMPCNSAYHCPHSRSTRICGKLATSLRQNLPDQSAVFVFFVDKADLGSAPAFTALQAPSSDELAMMKLFEETAFARDVLGHPDEDCWNDL